MITQKTTEINEMFEREKKEIAEHLFGYYTYALEFWWSGGYRKFTKEQQKELIEMLWTKLKENTIKMNIQEQIKKCQDRYLAKYCLKIDDLVYDGQCEKCNDCKEGETKT